MPIPFLAVAGAGIFAYNQYQAWKKRDPNMPKNAPEIYDYLLKSRLRAKPYRTAESYQKREGWMPLVRKAEMLVQDTVDSTTMTALNVIGDKLPDCVLMVQAIAVMGHRDLHDPQIRRVIIACVEGKGYHEIITSIAKSSVGKLAKTIGGLGGSATWTLKKVADAVFTHSHTGNMGQEAIRLFITGEYSLTTPTEVFGLRGDAAEIERCLECSQKLEENMGGMDGCYFVHHPGGKDAQKFYGAIYTYVLLEPDENPMMVYDTTLLGGADEGLAWTSKRLHYKNDKQYGQISYRDICDVACGEGGNVITLKDGAKIALSINASKKDLEKIADATRFMQERFLVDE